MLEKPGGVEAVPLLPEVKTISRRRAGTGDAAASLRVPTIDSPNQPALQNKQRSFCCAPSSGLGILSPGRSVNSPLPWGIGLSSA